VKVVHSSFLSFFPTKTHAHVTTQKKEKGRKESLATQGVTGKEKAEYYYQGKERVGRGHAWV
jgi:hypothetical protein